MSGELIRLLIGLIVSLGVLVLLNRQFKLHAFFCLLIAAVILGVITRIPLARIIMVMQNGFGNMLGQIGFVVALGSCLGVILEKTGAMVVIAHKVVKLFGTRQSLLAMSTLGVIVGIPVFCDSGFIILSRLIPTLALQSGVPTSSLALALSSGLYTTHSLVPPTPGPLAAAANLSLGENFGPVIIVGILGSIPVGLTGYLFAKKLGANFHASKASVEVSTLKMVGTWKAFLPLITPIILITLATLPTVLHWQGWFAHVLIILGQPFVALAIGLLLTLPLLKNIKQDTPAWITTALLDAGIILLITGAGGAFGNVIRESGLENILKGLFSQYNLSGIIFICFGFALAAVLKTVQGSTTSAMIITTSLLAPLASVAGFQSPVQLSTLVFAVGSGGMCVSHANDSYFWVVSQFGGISASDALNYFTRITFFQGVSGLLTSILIYLIW